MIPPGPIRVLVVTKPVDLTEDGRACGVGEVQEQFKADPFWAGLVLWPK